MSSFPVFSYFARSIKHKEVGLTPHAFAPLAPILASVRQIGPGGHIGKFQLAEPDGVSALSR
jgi:hypothetical protein